MNAIFFYIYNILLNTNSYRYVAMYNFDGNTKVGANQLFLSKALKQKQEQIAKDYFKRKQIQMIALADATTLAVNNKLKLIQTTKKESVERLTKLIQIQMKKNRNLEEKEESAMEFDQRVSKEEKTNGEKEEDENLIHPFYVYLIDEIIADFDLQIRNVSLF